MKPQAVVLLSGGLDSTTVLSWAQTRGFRCMALIVDYGQRHGRELLSARGVARAMKIPWREVRLELPWLASSSLVDRRRRLPDLPLGRIGKGPIPSTYVPGRNTVFLSLAASLADAEGAQAVVLGANQLDFSGYPDCRPAYFNALSRAVKLGTRAGCEGRGMRILAPLLRMTKADIIRLARRLRAPLGLTWSCYAGGSRPCGRCDACKLRAKGFREAGLSDPALMSPR